MTCQECKQRLAPENPEDPQYDRWRNMWLAPLCQGCPNAMEKELENMEARITNLESMVAQAGSIPRQYHNALQQMKGEINHMHQEVHALRSLKKQEEGW